MKKHVEEAIVRLRRDANGFFTSAEMSERCRAAIPIALSILASGRDLTTAIASLDLDMQLHLKEPGASASHRIDSSKQVVLRGITAYNHLIKQFRQAIDWYTPPDFVSM